MFWETNAFFQLVSCMVCFVNANNGKSSFHFVSEPINIFLSAPMKFKLMNSSPTLLLSAGLCDILKGKQVP